MPLRSGIWISRTTTSGRVSSSNAQGFLTAASFSGYQDIAGLLKKLANTSAHNSMVIDQEDTERGCSLVCHKNTGICINQG